MSEEGSIFNFMALVAESEAEAASPKTPFNLTQQNQKVIFQKVRAKNFRSVGNDWMEVDFLKAKSTLVVSEDNGSGKSTLTVWAPYFALFDKPYNPKELKAALVNSATNKDAMVELYFNTKGKNWLVKRGYKPSVFEILFQDENGAWIKDQAPAAMKDQQKYLESIIGFDAKIAENVMILGADKFTPFIEMDAPSRRHVVEQIWDLAVFPVMLKVAKEDLAVLTRDQDECSRSIDSTRERINHAHELLNQVLSKQEFVETLKVRVQGLTEKLSHLEQEREATKTGHEQKEVSLKEEIEAMKIELDLIVSEVESSFSDRISDITTRLEETKKEGQLEVDAAVSELDAELETLKEVLITQNREEEAALKELATEGSKLYTELNERLKNAEVEANAAAAKVRQMRGQFAFSKEGELTATLHELDALTPREKQLGASLDATVNSLNGISSQVSRIAGVLTNLNFQRDSKLKEQSDIQRQIEAFEHMGTCPTCSQTVGADAIEAFKKSFEDKLKQSDTSDLDKEIKELTESMNSAKESESSYTKEHQKIVSELQVLKAEIEHVRGVVTALEAEKVREHSTWEGATMEMEAAVKADCTQGTKAKISELIAQTKVSQAELKSQWEEKKRKTHSLFDYNQSKILRVKAEVGAKVAGEVGKIESELRNARSDFNAEITKRTADLHSKVETHENTLVDACRSYTQVMGRIVSEIKETQGALDADNAHLSQLQQSITDESSERQQAITQLEVELVALEHDHQVASERISVYKKLVVELGDKAAKAEIIKAYMPFLNHKVNEYLGALNLHVGFKMDENFSIEFTAPDRKRQTTWSLSKGQAMRMNLAMLFALREVANLKASVSTNLLIMDETLEALSERGVQEIMEMFEHRFKDVNMFVVTQRKAEFTEYFTDVINYGLRGGFTVEL